MSVLESDWTEPGGGRGVRLGRHGANSVDESFVEADGVVDEVDNFLVGDGLRQVVGGTGLKPVTREGIGVATPVLAVSRGSLGNEGNLLWLDESFNKPDSESLKIFEGGGEDDEALVEVVYFDLEVVNVRLGGGQRLELGDPVVGTGGGTGEEDKQLFRMVTRPTGRGLVASPESQSGLQDFAISVYQSESDNTKDLPEIKEGTEISDGAAYTSGPEQSEASSHQFQEAGRGTALSPLVLSLSFEEFELAAAWMLGDIKRPIPVEQWLLLLEAAEYLEIGDLKDEAITALSPHISTTLRPAHTLSLAR
ncbi:hypothetical protein M407DRAFT_7280 [Tulasnella calospora MUT 4182]|uniref:Uncharacterized protein n=1 Tax=Tulasnella calospora MUT 4182 TaxID=1051891 RepID=A0A0C3QAW2_9AGAM|nr:hypothetical protein M407DRAFT_7280 [Tulasnella calospora MUT 4182]